MSSIPLVLLLFLKYDLLTFFAIHFYLLLESYCLFITLNVSIELSLYSVFK